VSRLLRLLAGLALFLPALHPAGAGEPGSAEAVLDRLEKRMSAVRTVQTRFQQERTSVMVDFPLVSRGAIYLEKPSRLAWHLESPLKYRLVLEGDRVREWSEDSGRVQTFPLDRNPVLRAVFDQLGEWFSGSYRSLESRYRVVVVRERPAVLRFEPLQASGAAGIIRQVTVGFQDDERYIRELVIEEGSGDRTRIVFFETRLNEAPDPAAWEVEPVGK